MSPDPQAWLGYTAPVIPGSGLIPSILGTIAFLYGGLVFLRGALGELRDRLPGMMTLISLAIVVAFVTSWAGTLGLFDVEIWWELATLITIMLLGHWLEMRSIAQARGALAAGMHVVGVLSSSYPASELSQAHVIVRKLSDIEVVQPHANSQARLIVRVKGI